MSISVVIPCYNGEKYLAETLESVFKQTLPPQQILVIDDGSSDRSVEVAQSFGQRVTVLRQANGGVSSARNTGIERATGDWIAFLDADDLWEADKLEKQMLSVRAGTAGLYTEIVTFGTSQHRTQIAQMDGELRHSVEHLLMDNCYITPSALMVKRSLSPRFPTWTGVGEDLIYMLDLVQRGSIEIIDQPLTRYRKHPGGAAHSITSMIQGHKTVLRYLQQSNHQLSSDQVARVSDHWKQALVSIAWGMKHRRMWNEYWMFRKHLQSFAGDQAVDELLSNKIYPPLVYQLLDGFNKLRRADSVARPLQD